MSGEGSAGEGARWRPLSAGQAGGLRVLASEAGVRWERAGAGGGWSFGLQTRRVGREGAWQAVAPVAPDVAEGRASFARGRFGELEEWYRLRPEGTEQGFTIRTRPAGSGPLVIEQALGGALAPRAEQGGQRVTLALGGQAVARMDQLVVWDARGQKVPARMAVTEDARGIALVIEDQRAHYPLVVDPLIRAISAQTLRLEDATNVRQGASLAREGGTLLVGAPEAFGGRGAVFAYDTTQSPARLQVIAAPSALSQPALGTTRFGASVAVSGEWMAVGAPAAASISGPSGAVCLYRRVNGAWTLQGAPLQSTGSGVLEDGFGEALAMHHDVLVIGSPRETSEEPMGGPSHPRGGVVYVYLRDMAGWARFGPPIQGGVWVDGALLGSAVALEGDAGQSPTFLYVGAPGSTQTQPSDPDNILDEDRTGVVRAFMPQSGDWRTVGQTPDAWDAIEQPFLPPPPNYMRNFGAALAVHGDRLAVGAPGSGVMNITTGQFDPIGTAWLFKRTNLIPYAAWDWGEALPPQSQPGVQPIHGWGARVALTQDHILLSGYRNASGGEVNGMVCAYLAQVDNARPLVGPPGCFKHPNDANRSGLAFGAALAADGAQVLVSAPGDSTITSGQRSGSIRRMQPDPNTPLQWNQTAEQIADTGSIEGAFGRVVRAWGDRVVVGAPQQTVWDAQREAWVPNAGAVHVYERGPDGLVLRQQISAAPPQEDGQFGTAVAIRDGLLVVGAPGANGRRGQVRVYSQNASGIFAPEVEVASQATWPDWLGASMTITPDALFIGAPGIPGASDASGAVVVLPRLDQGAMLGPARLITPPQQQPGDGFGMSLSVHQDALYVGAPTWRGAQPNTGRVYRFGRDVGGAGLWGHVATLERPTGFGLEGFGEHVSVNARYAAVGVWWNVRGAVVVFNRDNAPVKVLEDPARDALGGSLALGEDVLAVSWRDGALLYDGMGGDAPAWDTPSVIDAPALGAVVEALALHDNVLALGAPTSAEVFAAEVSIPFGLTLDPLPAVLNPTPTFTGTTRPGATVSVLLTQDASTQPLSATADAQGVWRAITTQPLIDGPVTLTITATLGARDAAPLTASATVDTTPPRLVSSAPASGDTITSPSPTFRITADEPIVLATLSDGTPNPASDPTFASQAGEAMFDLAWFARLTPGPHNMRVELVDRAGNRSTTTIPITVQAAEDDKVSLTSPEANTVFTEAGDLVLKGDAPINARLTITTRGGALLGSLVVAQRAWTFTRALDTLGEGDHPIKVTCEAPGGTVSEATVRITVDLDAPPIRIDDMDPADNTVEGNPTVRGTTTPGSTVSLFIVTADAPTEAVVIATLTANDSGAWSHTPDPALDPATYIFTVTADLPSGRGSDTGALTATVLPEPPAALRSDRCTTTGPHAPAPARHAPLLLLVMLVLVAARPHPDGVHRARALTRRVCWPSLRVGQRQP